MKKWNKDINNEKSGYITVYSRSGSRSERRSMHSGSSLSKLVNTYLAKEDVLEVYEVCDDNKSTTVVICRNIEWLFIIEGDKY